MTGSFVVSIRSRPCLLRVTLDAVALWIIFCRKVLLPVLVKLPEMTGFSEKIFFKDYEFNNLAVTGVYVVTATVECFYFPITYKPRLTRHYDLFPDRLNFFFLFFFFNLCFLVLAVALFPLYKVTVLLSALFSDSRNAFIMFNSWTCFFTFPLL